jgi:hypothetical protein
LGLFSGDFSGDFFLVIFGIFVSGDFQANLGDFSDFFFDDEFLGEF